MVMNTGHATDGSLLLEVPVPFRVQNKVIFVESQAHQGLGGWLDNFSRVTVCAPVVPDQWVDATMTWVPVDDLIAKRGLAVELLPWGYAPRAYLRQVKTVRAQFRELIPKHQYLCFANLGFFGAWGSVAAEEAFRQRRPYAVWLDWVLHEMPMKTQKNPAKILWERLNRALLKRAVFRDIGRAALGLFNGSSVYEAYAPVCRVAKLAHDIHLREKDIIPTEALEARLSRDVDSVKILYVGRVHEMKGPIYWVECLQRLSASAPNLKLSATWLGDGPMLEQLRALVLERGLADWISFPGSETDRSKVVDIYRGADLFLFCHLTPESPRCLVEALMSGLPIIGFDSAYARDLIKTGGGATAPLRDTDALAALVAKYSSDGAARNELSRAALLAGREFSEEAAFNHRASSIKQFA